MGLRASLGLIKPALQKVKYITPKCEIFSAKSFDLELKQLSSDVVQLSKPKSELDKLLQVRDFGDFKRYKDLLTQYLTKNNYQQYRQDWQWDLVEEIKTSKNMEEVNDNLRFLMYRIFGGYDTLLADESLGIVKSIQSQSFSPELDKKYIDYVSKIGDMLKPILKLTTKSDVDAKVIAIKNEILRKYNMEELLCNNDIEFAKACKEVFNKLEKNNIKIPKTVIANETFEPAGLSTYSKKGDYIIINKDGNGSDLCDIGHLIAHETIHTTQPKSLAFMCQIIPENLKSVADNVSEYAQGNFAHEVHCELAVKKIFAGLSKEEEELFAFLSACM